MATPSLLRSLSQKRSEAADAPPHRCRWAPFAHKQELARESHGACFFHDSFWLVKSTAVSERSGVAQSNFWTRSKRVNKSRPGGCPCQRPLLRVPAYLRCVGGLKLHDSRASIYFSLGSSKSWLHHPCFEAHRKIVRKLLIRHLIVVLGPTLHVNRCSLARASGPFPPTAASASLK